MTLSVDVVAKLDERAAAMAATQLKNQMVRAGAVSGEAFTKALNEAANKYKFSVDRINSELEKQFTSHGQRAAQHFGTGFGGQLARSLPGVSGFTSAMAGYEGAAAKTGALAGRALGLAFTTAAGGLIGAAGYTLFKGFERYEAIDTAKSRLDNLNRTLQSTGKETINVAAVMQTVNDVVVGTPFKLDQAFSVATRALASNTGDLKRFMTDVANAAGFANAGIDDIGEAFLKIANQGKVSMEELNNELRNIPIQAWLAETMGKSGAEIAKMIHDNKIGLEDLLRTVEQHAPNFAKSAGETIKGQLDIMQATVARAGANFLGAIFGKPAEDSNQLLQVLKTLNERLDDVGKWISAHQNDIRDFFQSAVQTIQDVYNAIKSLVDILGGLGPTIRDIAAAFAVWETIKGVGMVATAVNTLNAGLLAVPAGASGAATAMGGFAAALGPLTAAAAAAIALDKVLSKLGASKIEIPGSGLWFAHGLTTGDWNFSGPKRGAPKSPGGITDADVPPPVPGDGLHWEDGRGWVLDQSWVGLPGTGEFLTPQGDPLAPGGGAPGPGGAAPHGGPIQPPSGATGGGKGKGPHLPKAPVVPYDTTLPPGFENLPMSAGLYSAESSYLDNKHKLAEKQARLAQLEKDGAATEQDVLEARNDVVTAGRDLQQAEMRLYEERASIFGKHTKQIKSWLSELGEIGASLDQDFGISKGLAGIAENITKFIANLAAAPLLGQLGASQIAAGYKPGEAGQGLMGALAAGGAFGSQYQLTPFGSFGQGSQGGGFGAYGGGYPAMAGPLPGLSVPTGANVYPGAHTENTGGSLVPRAAAVKSMLQQMFPGLDIGGWRPPDGFKEHSSGEALDIMVGGNKALGDQINQFLLANAGALGLQYDLWQQQTWKPGQAPTMMENRGSGTQNHMDHVHARFQPGPLTGGDGGGSWFPAAPGGPPGVGAVPGVYPSSFGTTTGGGFSAAPAGFGPGGAPLAPGGVGGWIGGPGGAPGGPQPGVPGQGLPGLPGTSNPTRIGGVAAPEGKGRGGAALGGLTMGAINSAISAAGMAGDAAGGFGGGQAAAAIAQAMMQLANRGIQFASQAAGIGVQGLMETFLPAGSELANSNWITKIAGGVAGAMPMLPNLAGKGDMSSQQLTPDQVVGQGQGMGMPGDDQAKNVDKSKNINITNNNTFNAANYSENSMANSVASAQQAMYSA